MVFILTISLNNCLYSQFDKSEYAARRIKLMEKIPDGIAIILGAQATGSYNRYYQNNDMMYFSGVEIPNAILVIDGIKKESVLLFTSTENQARNEGISFDFVRNPKEFTGIEKVLGYDQFSEYLDERTKDVKKIYTSFFPEELIRECTNEKLRHLQRSLTNNEWDTRLTRELQFIEILKEKYSGVKIKDCAQMIWDLRIIKSQAEIELLREAGKIGVMAHNTVLKAIKPGMKENEAAALFEYICKKEGAQDLSYYVILSSGENHPYVHYNKYDRTLKDGDFVVMDAGPDYHYYDIDITISFPVNGKFAERQKEIYNMSNDMHEACMKVYRPGLTMKQAKIEINKILTDQGYDVESKLFKKFRFGYFGHYVGMAVHDVGRSPQVLKAGMVIANEPYAVFPDEDLGVRVEDTILITEDGCENLTSGIPRTVKQIEEFMKK